MNFYYILFLVILRLALKLPKRNMIHGHKHTISVQLFVVNLLGMRFIRVDNR